MGTYLKNNNQTKISDKLTTHAKVPERQEQTKFKHGRWQEKTRFRADISETENNRDKIESIK